MTSQSHAAKKIPLDGLVSGASLLSPPDMAKSDHEFHISMIDMKFKSIQTALKLNAVPPTKGFPHFAGQMLDV